MSSFGAPPMAVGQPMSLPMSQSMNPVGLGSQMQGSGMQPLGGIGQMQSFGPNSDFLSPPYGRQPYGYGDSNAGLYPGMSQYPVGQSQVLSRRFGYGMMPGLLAPPLAVGPPIVGPPMIGPPVMGYPYGGYDPILW